MTQSDDAGVEGDVGADADELRERLGIDAPARDLIRDEQRDP